MILITLISRIIGVVLKGWVLTIFWVWFIIPAFKLDYTISIASAISFMFLISFIQPIDFNKKLDTSKTPIKSDYVGVIAGSIIIPFIYLGIGYIIKLFI